MTPKKLSILIIAGATAVAVGIGVVVAETRSDVAEPPAPGPQDQGPVIATVDSAPIYLAEVRSRVAGLTSVHGGTIEQALGKRWKPQLLQSLVDDRIVEQQAAALGVTVSPADLQQHVDKISAMFQTDQGFQDWLGQNGMSEADLQARVKLQSLASLLYLEVTQDAAPTPDEVRAYFDSHRQDYLGVDGKPALFIAVKDQIQKNLDKKARDRAYADWLKLQRDSVKVVVIDPMWWQEVES